MMGRMVYYDSNGNEIEPAKADPVPMTNADRIRAMSDEELSEMFCLMSGGIHPFSISDSSDGEQWIKWLKGEVQDG